MQQRLPHPIHGDGPRAQIRAFPTLFLNADTSTAQRSNVWSLLGRHRLSTGRRVVIDLSPSAIARVFPQSDSHNIEFILACKLPVLKFEFALKIAAAGQGKQSNMEALRAAPVAEASNESELREQLAAKAKDAVQGELEELKKRSEEAEEKLERTQREIVEMKKLAEINNKTMEENNALLKHILFLNNASST